jgi:hypothetical protein
MKDWISPSGMDYHRAVSWTFLHTMYEKYIECGEGSEDLTYYVGMCDCEAAQAMGHIMMSQASSGHCEACGKLVRFTPLQDLVLKRRRWLGQEGFEEVGIQDAL